MEKLKNQCRLLVLMCFDLAFTAHFTSKTQQRTHKEANTTKIGPPGAALRGVCGSGLGAQGREIDGPPRSRIRRRYRYRSL